MNELQKINPNYSTEALFDKTYKSAEKPFDEEVKGIVSNLKKSKNDISFLYIDKNIVPNNIEKHFKVNFLLLSLVEKLYFFLKLYN